MHEKSGTSPIEIPQDISQVIVSVQQVLVKSGYRYVAVYEERWPLSPALMLHGESPLMIDIWHRDILAANIDRWQALTHNERNAGLLLIGCDDIHDTLLDNFFANAHGAIAYIDARTRQFRLSPPSVWGPNPPGILREASLTSALTAENAALAAHIDCREAMRRDIADSAPVHKNNFWIDKLHEVKRAPLTHLLILACVLIFLGTLHTASHLSSEGDPFGTALKMWGGLDGALVRHGQWWRLLTSGFLHGGVLHLLMNMFALYILAVQLEYQQGKWRLAAIFLYSILLGNLFSLFWLPQVLSVGASGGLFGLVGAYAAMPVRFRAEMSSAQRKSLFKWIGSMLFYNILIAFVPGINWVAHVGGLLGGFVLGFLLLRSPRPGTQQPKWIGIALAALLIATALFGYLAVMRIPWL